MKKTKRILAMLGAILLLGMYLCTFIFAMIKSPLSMQLFRASIFCTIVVPVILYMYMLVYRRVKGKKDPEAVAAADGAREQQYGTRKLQDEKTEHQDSQPDEEKRQTVNAEEETQEVTDE